MSSGQSARNGNSVEPGLPNTFAMPKARNRSSVASLTVTDVAVDLVGLRDNADSSTARAARLPSPLPLGEVGAKRRVRGYGITIDRTPSPQPSPHGRGGRLPSRRAR